MRKSYTNNRWLCAEAKTQLQWPWPWAMSWRGRFWVTCTLAAACGDRSLLRQIRNSTKLELKLLCETTFVLYRWYRAIKDKITKTVLAIPSFCFVSREQIFRRRIFPTTKNSWVAVGGEIRWISYARLRRKNFESELVASRCTICAIAENWLCRPTSRDNRTMPEGGVGRGLVRGCAGRTAFSSRANEERLLSLFYVTSRSLYRRSRRQAFAFLPGVWKDYVALVSAQSYESRFYWIENSSIFQGTRIYVNDVNRINKYVQLK